MRSSLHLAMTTGPCNKPAARPIRKAPRRTAGELKAQLKSAIGLLEGQGPPLPALRRIKAAYRVHMPLPRKSRARAGRISDVCNPAYRAAGVQENRAMPLPQRPPRRKAPYPHRRLPRVASSSYMPHEARRLASSCVRSRRLAHVWPSSTDAEPPSPCALLGPRRSAAARESAPGPGWGSGAPLRTAVASHGGGGTGRTPLAVRVLEPRRRPLLGALACSPHPYGGGPRPAAAAAASGGGDFPLSRAPLPGPVAVHHTAHAWPSGRFMRASRSVARRPPARAREAHQAARITLSKQPSILTTVPSLCVLLCRRQVAPPGARPPRVPSHQLLPPARHLARCWWWWVPTETVRR